MMRVIEQLPETSSRAAVARLAALADPIRLRLLVMIRHAPAGEICACDLPDAVGRAQPTVSHHLAVLVRAGLVVREQRGKWAWFSVAEDEVESLDAIIGAVVR
jgi:ArsR family transcriptional regulator